MRELLQQSGHVRAHGNEHPWILEGKAQRAVAAHGDAFDRAAAPVVRYPEAALHLRNKFANEKIFVEHVSVAGVDVEGVLALRRDDYEFAQALLLPGVLNCTGSATGGEKALVAAQPVQEIQDGKALAGIGVVTGRQHGAKADAAGNVLALHGAALHARFGESTD